MIILPEQNIPRGKILLPMRRRDWRQSSQRTGIYQIENETRFRVRALLHDGHVAWCGYFDDREDFDAFLYAAVTGSLRYERALWDLPQPTWRPDIAEGLVYDFATLVFITTTSGSAQNWTVPSDWSSADNSIHAIGCASGSGGGRSGTNAGGGSAGAWAKTNNVSLTPGGTAKFFLNVGGSAGAPNGGDGGNGPDVWLSNTASAPTSTSEGVLAKGGTGTSSSGQVPGAGGLDSACIGHSKNSGGGGGFSDHNPLGGAGGGAGGPNGPGNGPPGGGSSAGGSADGGTVAAGPNNGGVGLAGTQFDATHGCGSGAGGGSGGGYLGGLYGGGPSGGSSNGNSAGEQGRQGLLHALYTPTTNLGYDPCATTMFIMP